MPSPAASARVFHFGLYEVDLQEGELRKNGIRIKLQDQPFQILNMLLQHPGQTVTREELRHKLWPTDTFVDFDHSLNSSINKLREALGDKSENPRFIETLHKRGYRFIAPVKGSGATAPAPIERITSFPAIPPALGGAQETRPPVVVQGAPKWLVFVIVASAITLLTASGLEIYAFLTRPAPRPFQNFVVTQVTNSGKVKSAAISPDGKSVAFVQSDKGMQSVWLRNLPSGSDTQIIAPSTADYECLRFLPDGNYLYFIIGRNANWDGYNLFRSPVFGGNPQFVLGHMNTETCYAFSPDGRRIVAGRLNYPEACRYQILTISSEGGSETILQTGSTSKQPWDLAWHPNRDEIYFSFYSREEGIYAIDVFDLSAGRSHRFLTFSDKYVGPLYWLPDGQNMFVSYSGQIGFIRSTGREVEPITRDVTGFLGKPSISAQGKTIATLQGRGPMMLSVLSRTGPEFTHPQTILSQPGSDRSCCPPSILSISPFVIGGKLAWDPDGDLLWNSGTRILKVRPGATNEPQPLADIGVEVRSLKSCGTNYLVVGGAYPGKTNFRNIWRMNTDGSNPVKLTDGKVDVYPVCSPDLKWVYYLEAISQRIFRVPMDGSGKPEVLFDVPAGHYFAGGLTISSAGKMLAAPVTQPSTGVNIALYEIGPYRPPRIFDAGIYSPHDTFLESTHDGNSVAYIKRHEGVDNLWVNRLDGSPARPITDFNADEIYGFSFSVDGKKLAVLRGHTESDVVLLQETNPGR